MPFLRVGLCTTLAFGLAACGARSELFTLDASAPLPAADVLVPPPIGPIVPPRPIAPLSTSHVTSRRPTVRWTSDPRLAGTRVQFCADRACARLLATTDVPAGVTQARPDVELPRGVVFWRLRGLAGGVPADGTSPTWEFTVPARSGPRDTAWGTVLDVNGDGYSDVAVSSLRGFADERSRVFLYYGSPAGLPDQPSVVLEPGSSTFALFPHSAGDVNGDGFGDFIAADASSAILYLGSPSGVDPTRGRRVATGGNTLVEGTAVGDLDGDGYGDVVDEPSTTDRDGNSVIRVFVGGPSGVEDHAARVVSVPDGLAIGSFTGFVDTDGDGRGEVTLNNGLTGFGSFIALYSGLGVGGTFVQRSLLRRDPDDEMSNYGQLVQVLGDVDGDGYVDLGTVAHQGFTTAWVIRGRADGTLDPARIALSSPHMLGGGVGEVMRALGDIDGDGRDDVAAGSIGDAVFVYTGGSRTPTITLPAPVSREGFAEGMTCMADWNGDGFTDLGVGDEAPPMSRLVLYEGSASGLPSMPTGERHVMGAERYGDAVASSGGAAGVVGAANLTPPATRAALGRPSPSVRWERGRTCFPRPVGGVRFRRSAAPPLRYARTTPSQPSSGNTQPYGGHTMCPTGRRYVTVAPGSASSPASTWRSSFGSTGGVSYTIAHGPPPG